VRRETGGITGRINHIYHSYPLRRMGVA
jgi:hypothetical protein